MWIFDKNLWSERNSLNFYGSDSYYVNEVLFRFINMYSDNRHLLNNGDEQVEYFAIYLPSWAYMNELYPIHV